MARLRKSSSVDDARDGGLRGRDCVVVVVVAVVVVVIVVVVAVVVVVDVGVVIVVVAVVAVGAAGDFSAISSLSSSAGSFGPCSAWKLRVCLTSDQDHLDHFSATDCSSKVFRRLCLGKFLKIYDEFPKNNILNTMLLL